MSVIANEQGAVLIMLRKGWGMDFLKIFLAVLLGFVLGAFLSDPHSAKAKGGTVTIKEVSGRGSSSVEIGSDEVVGFACTSTSCFVALR